MISILVVEDNKLVQELIALIVFQEFGIETIQSYELGQAQRDLLMESPDLIILDLNLLNKMGIVESGKDLLEWMKSKSNVIPTILFSGEKNEEVYIECASIGIIDVIYKEADTFHSDLINSISTFIKSQALIHNKNSWLI